MNTTHNGSTCFSSMNPSAVKVGETVAYCLILVVSLVGNSSIAIIIYKTQMLRKPINFFIANMAMSDLLYPIVLFPWNLTTLHANSLLISGPLGEALCKLVPFLAHVSSRVSILSLVLIAVDRLGAVVFPLRCPFISSKLCQFFLVATWIVAMAICTPFLVANKLVQQPGQLACRTMWNEAFEDPASLRKYLLAVFAVFFYIPIAFLAVVYSIILITLKLKKTSSEQSTRNAEQRRARRNRNVLKMAIAIVLAFVLCWVPLSIVKFFTGDGKFSCLISVYWSIALFTARANSAINPCICFIFSENYRRGLKRLLQRNTTVQPVIPQ